MQDLVMDRFRVLERIGSGGMGTVYRAYDERLQREVALKELEAADPERVLREAQAAARLNHPAIVTLYELGEHAGHAVLVSELVPGETLASLEAAGMLCDRDVAEITADLCDALAHAHARGVVHRDIKPQNVIVRDDRRAGRRAKLMDFGIARIAGAPTLTAAGEVVGTLAYMSPEQADGELAGPETDVYSLALTAYECWAGVNPVAGRTPAQTARRIGTELAPLRAHRPDLPEGLADTIDACLEPEPQLRPIRSSFASAWRPSCHCSTRSIHSPRRAMRRKRSMLGRASGARGSRRWPRSDWPWRCSPARSAPLGPRSCLPHSASPR